jgi:DUF4097 and DUF4098 domain-containing protein YvlB
MTLTRLAGALLFPPLLAGCTVGLDSQSQIVKEEKRFAVSGRPSVHVTTFDGSIQIQSWDQPGVLVQIEKRGATREAVDALEVKASQDGNSIELEVKRPSGDGFSHLSFHRSATARLIVSLPRQSDVRARSGDGSILIEHVNGRLEMHTGDGSIKATDISGELTLNTGDGSVTVNGAEGNLNLDTGDGSVNVTGKLAGVRLHTGDGSIVYHAQPGTEMTDDWQITTGDGSVALYLPSEFAADLDAHTGDGSITSDLGVAAEGSGKRDRHTVRGRIGEGGRKLRIRTGDGSIRLRTGDAERVQELRDRTTG